MQLTSPLLITLIAYLLLMFYLGSRAFSRIHTIGDYILGGRRLGPMVTALSVGASDMSGWLLMGLPGAIYLSGISEAWIALGLVIGAYCNWRFVSVRLRIYSHQANNSLTLPDYFENRFDERRPLLRVISASVILLFFTFYTASGLVGGAILFEQSFGMPYEVALGTGALIIVSYTFVGGFLAVCWTDAVQASLILLAIVIAPVLVLGDAGSVTAVLDNLHRANPNSSDSFSGMTLLALCSLLAWGLGYLGQPHILARFMAIENHEKLVAARRIAMSWMVIVLTGSILTGLAGIAYFADQPLANPETVFIALSQTLFNPWIAGLVAAAILSAIMSTVDSQLLVSSSVISEDFYRVFIRPGAGAGELLWVSRLAVVAIAVFAVLIASDRDSRVLDLVSYAWAGFGAAFGPVIVFSLFWQKMTSNAAIAGIVAGASTVVLWSSQSGGLFELYEIAPGFLLASLAILTVSFLKPQDSPIVLQKFADFDRVVKSG